MLEKLIEIMFSGFWKFIGGIVLLNVLLISVLNILYKMYCRFLRTLIIRKHGWPPSHLDADGDWKPETKS